MSGVLDVTILGCGFSGGVPRADGEWGRCDPANPKNRRSRCSLLVRRRAEEGSDPTTVIVDTSPDLRLQAVAAGVKRVDAALITHDHADQTHGIDDLRGFFLRQGARIPYSMDAATADKMTDRFSYIFNSVDGYPAICDARAVPPLGTPFEVDGPSGPIPVTTFDQDHGSVRSVGYRFGGLAYSSDVVALPEEAFETLRDLDVWIVDALRYKAHPTHANLAQALAWIERVKPRRAILTNMHNDLDHTELSAQLPAGVEAAYDGLTVTLSL